MKPPNSRERQMMQRLRGVSWVKAFEVADSPKIFANLIERGWVENQRTDGGKMYRLTDLGLEAMKAPIGLKAKK